MELVEDYVRVMMASPRAIDFLGVRGYLSHRGVANLGTPWGWKDPRNTFTLPLWLRVFPKARIVCIERHGVDVAQSLLAREHKIELAARRRYRRYKYLAWIRPKRGGFLESSRCATLSGGFTLWEEYQRQVEEILADLDPVRVARVRYEDLLSNPSGNLESLAKFCGLDPTPRDVQRACRGVNADRAYAYAEDPELRAFAESRAQALAAYGY